jgi:transcriptional regulator with XRE-family HTH domain
MIANIERSERRVDVVEFIAIARALGIGELELMRDLAAALGSSKLEV